MKNTPKIPDKIFHLFCNDGKYFSEKLYPMRATDSNATGKDQLFIDIKMPFVISVL